MKHGRLTFGWVVLLMGIGLAGVGALLTGQRNEGCFVCCGTCFGVLLGAWGLRLMVSITNESEPPEWDEEW